MSADALALQDDPFTERRVCLMFLDHSPLRDRSEITADVAIVGAGPAEISLALRLAQKPRIDVVLLEGGELRRCQEN